MLARKILLSFVCILGYLFTANPIPVGGVSPVAASEIFWNDQDGIHRASKIGDAGKLLFDTFDSFGLAVDAADQRIYWTDILPIVAPIPPGVVRAGSTAGGAFDTLASRLDQPSGIAVDREHGNIYWTDLGSETRGSGVYVAKLDGSDAKRIIGGSSFSAIAGIAIDSPHARLYFTYINPLIGGLRSGAIGRANLDGSNVETIVGGLGQPLGIAVDAAGGGVYWADALANLDVGRGAVMTADLEGKNERAVVGGLEGPFGVALDLERRDVYWTLTKAGLIQRTAMSGVLPFIETVYSGLSAPTAIAIVPEPSGWALAATAGVMAIAARKKKDPT